MAPSLVTWPTMMTRSAAVAWRSAPARGAFAQLLRRPGLDAQRCRSARSGSNRSAAKRACCSAARARMASSELSLTQPQMRGAQTPGAARDRRSARRLLAGSVEHRRDRAPMAAAACSSSVDLPMPGSPPAELTEPETSPPPNTRSSSLMPLDLLRVSAAPAVSASGGARLAGAGGRNAAHALTRLERVPLAAMRALALPFEGFAPAGTTDIDRLLACHS